MASTPNGDHPLYRLFRGLTEHTFGAELGIADPRLVEYVSDLLTRFVPSEGVWKIRDKDGRRLFELTAILDEAASTSDDRRRRECLQHVGDSALFWTGVFPESIASRPGHLSADQLVDYQQQGKRSYLLASTYDDAQAPLLRRLSAEFELCAYGLSRVRREWERLDPPPSSPGRPIVIA
jgi:hypothetical protein